MRSIELRGFVEDVWDRAITPTLIDYIRIPNKSPAFDADWAAHGHMDAAIQLFHAWAKAQLHRITGATVEIVSLPGRTPTLLIEVPASDGSDSEDCVLLYGHIDKQPEMVGWTEGRSPWAPMLDGDKLYGRGGADDGYAMFGALTAILALHSQGVPHGRCLILIEACEESGSYDLPYYIDHLAPRLGEPSLIICLDSGCGNYDQLWVTTSLRGMVGGTLTVRVLEEGVHSGDASGVVPSTFRILRQLLERLEDAETGVIKPAALYAEIPEERRRQAAYAAQLLGDSVHEKFPFAAGVQPVGGSLSELLLNRSWRPQLEIIGADGFPSLGNAGNVLRPYSSLKLSLRVPPCLDAKAASETLKTLLERDPPYGAQVSYSGEKSGSGWNATPLAPWLAASLDKAAEISFGGKPAFLGEGGSIPFLAMLGERFPATQFAVMGVLGPHSNAHGPNEFLHLPSGKNVTIAVAQILADHYARPLTHLKAA